MSSLVAAWQDAITAFEDTVAEVPDADFVKPSNLPGWTVGDIVAHVAALEAELAGHPMLAHEPDWDALPHANDLFSRYTEVGVDARRGWSPDQVRAELREMVLERSGQLAGAHEDDVVTGIAGREMVLGTQLRMRCFDIVVHDFDIRDALGWPPPVLGPGAGVCIGQIAAGLGYVFVKRAGAVAGQVLHVVVPDWVDAWLEVGEDGRGRPGSAGEATVSITLPAEQFIRLGTGRGGDLDAAAVSGDVDLGRAVLAGLNVAP
jgi:uncharacterized protein (TIGR03083 family)